MTNAEFAIFKSWNDYKNQVDKNRLKNNEKLIDFYNTSQVQYLKQYINLEKIDDFPFTQSNITKRIIKKLSETYKDAPVRLINDKTNNKYNDLTEIKNVKMKQCERQSNLLGIVGLRPVVKDGKFDYKILRNFQVEIDVFMEVTALRYVVAQDDKLNMIYEYWSPEYHTITDNDGNELDGNEYGLESTENEYGVIPFVWLRNEFIIDDWYNLAGNADDIIDANLHIDLLLSEMNHKYRYAAFNPPYVTGDNIDTSQLTYGYNTILSVNDSQANIGNLNLDHNFNVDIEMIKFQVQLIERNRGLNINWGVSGSPSGFSLVVQNIDHTDDLRNMKDVCLNWEREIYEMEKIIGKVDGIAVPDGKIDVDFADVQMPISQDDKNKKWDFEFRNGLSTKADYWRAENPDITDEEIEKRLNDTAQEIKTFNEQSGQSTSVENLFNA